MPEPGTADELRQVGPEEWVDRVSAAREQGFTWFDALVAVDEVGRSDELRVVVRLVAPTSPHGVQLHVRVPRDGAHLPTLTGVFAGAGWHERQAHDFFGITFDGADQAPLLNHDETIRPLRKDFVLGARAVTPWPGAKEPGEGAGAPSRRKMVPPGVPDAATWGERDPAAPAPSAEEVAAAVAGGRVRRRR